MPGPPCSGATATASPGEERHADEPELCRYVKFEAQTIHRRQIKNAPYNPRIIKGVNRDKLKANLKKIGLINAPVWNKRTGNLVGGHQRLSILDQLMRTDDYLIPVDVVDMGEAAERAQCVALNNSSLMGQFDLGKIKELVVSGLDLESAGIDAGEAAEVLGMEALAGEAGEKLKDLTELLNASKAMHDRAKASASNNDEADFYRVVVFKDRKAAEWLSEFLDTPGVMFLAGDILRAKVESAGKLYVEDGGLAATRDGGGEPAGVGEQPGEAAG